MDCTVFLESHWTKTFVRMARSDPSFYTSLFPESDLEYALSKAADDARSIKILDAHRPFRSLDRYADAQSAYRSGNSLRLDGIQRFSPKLMLLVRALERELSCFTGINMYLTPGKIGARALPKHYDTHDVFVLQVRGEKKWRIYTPPTVFPLEYVPPIRGEEDELLRIKKQVAHQCLRDASQISDEFTLKAGDLLYLPRGYWHQAESVDANVSCHLAIGVRPYTYLELLTVAIAQVAALNVNLRKPLPTGFATLKGCPASVRESVAGILESLQTHIDPDKALAEMAEIFSSRVLG